MNKITVLRDNPNHLQKGAKVSGVWKKTSFYAKKQQLAKVRFFYIIFFTIRTQKIVMMI